MTSADEFDLEGTSWWHAEKSWVAWLRSQGQVVTHLAAATGNTPHSEAPLIAIGENHVRAPDIEAKAKGLATYWEVKYRTRATVDSITGTSEHWMSYASFADYLRVHEHAAPVRVALFEAATATRPGRWLQASIDDLREYGREERRHGRGGEEMLAWVWPTAAMSPVAGPTDPDVDQDQSPIVPDEGLGEGPQPTVEELAPVERTVRRARRDRAVEPVEATSTSAHHQMGQAIESDTATGLDVLRRVLGLPTIPSYSVLRIGAAGCDLEELLGLLEYGIRVFLVTGPDPDGGIDGRGLRPFAEARLIEWAVLDEDPGDGAWVVDGDPEALGVAYVEKALQLADQRDGINVGQYRVVHASPEADVLVTAGAGTGKTETMAERLVFLLSVWAGRTGADGRPTDLRLSDLALITFTNDAAREIRSRLSRTLTLRRRLAPMSVQPLAWLLEIGTMQISTIHSFAKQIVQRHGSTLGLSPGFRVAKHLLAFRRQLQEILSTDLQQLFRDHGQERIPAAHSWENHIEQIWSALGGNGIDLIGWDSTDVDTLADVDWGIDDLNGLAREIAQATKSTVEAIAIDFADLCRSTDTLPADSLVPTAIATLQHSVDGPRLTTVFVDEFQDTDPMQMSLLLTLRERLGTRLVVVGDAKQGIYRFRGAEGDAFDHLEQRFQEAGLDSLVTLSLTWSFRSHVDLLDSLHPHFERWATAGLLPYDSDDRLRPAISSTAPTGDSLELAQVPAWLQWGRYAESAADQVMEWRDHHPGASIAILCRINRHAVAVQRELRSRGASCELVVGGDFFQTEAVRELRSLLDAVVSPHDDAALLELAETRWAGGLLEENTRIADSSDDADLWRGDLGLIRPWQERILEGPGPGSFARDDLESLRDRVHSLRRAATDGSTLEWLVNCIRVLEPQHRARPDDDDRDRVRYLRCLDHAITLLDDEFGDRPISLDRVLGWLRLKIDTRFPEDEPVDRDALEGRTTALTVHKAKGLEFDLIIVPHTWLQFGPHEKIPTTTAVLRQPARQPRLVWRWKDPNPEVSNVSAGAEDLWTIDNEETAKEEARLLYVALTRARSRAKVLVSQHADGGTPERWSDLLTMGDAR